MLRRLLKAVLPEQTVDYIRHYKRDQAIRVSVAALQTFLREHDATEAFPEALLRDLAVAWGNPSYIARPDLLRGVLMHARALPRGSTILECGSGCTTIALAVVAQHVGAHVHALEQEGEWVESVRRTLRKERLSSGTVLHLPLRSYEGGFDWYVQPALDCRIDLVLCDGPPGITAGGRYGLLAIMGKHLAENSVIILDDIERLGEELVLARWKAEFPITTTQNSVFATITWCPAA